MLHVNTMPQLREALGHLHILFAGFSGINGQQIPETTVVIGHIHLLHLLKCGSSG